MKKISKMKSSKSGISLSSSSVSSTMMTNGKGKNGINQTNVQDEANLKLLRDLSHLVPANRNCFDCGQRGPTYVNVTIGSFVCMTCSGLLRGITPPHRVKSISMASFTPDEIELFKNRGNEYCRKVWLATCSSKDSQLGSEKDPDRMNALKSFMSATYEQKRYYIDPSRLPKSDLEEIQNQNARALLSAPTPASSQSSSSGYFTSSNSSQKSPSLSSTHSDPSPVLNNVRSNGFSQLHQNGKPSRLASSITLPDIKPLASLIGPSSTSISADLSTLSLSSSSSVSSGLNPPPSKPNNNPISFINNLMPGETQNKVVNNQSPWGDSGGFSATSNGTSSNDFIPDFADFDDAFNNTSTNGNHFQSDMSQQTNGFNGNGTNHHTINNVFPTSGFPLTPKMVNGGFQPFSGPNTQHQQPLLPQHHGNGLEAPTNGHGLSNGVGHNLSPSNPSTNANASDPSDKYAALKDLDSLFKQSSTGDGLQPQAQQQQSSALSSSASVPANLSSSLANNETTGWFSTSPPNQQNPFSQGSTNGWLSSSNGMNGGVVTNGQNPHNPFAGNGNVWGSPSSGNLMNGNHNSIFPISASPSAPSHMNFSSSVFTPGINGTGNGGVAYGKTAFNPFFPQGKANPNNPFL